jgi:hypothetical protein
MLSFDVRCVTARAAARVTSRAAAVVLQMLPDAVTVSSDVRQTVRLPRIDAEDQVGERAADR